MLCLFLPRFIRLVTTDEDNKRLKTELSEMKARHRLEIERVTREKEQEMDEVHKRFVMDHLLATGYTLCSLRNLEISGSNSVLVILSIVLLGGVMAFWLVCGTPSSSAGSGRCNVFLVKTLVNLPESLSRSRSSK